MEFYKDEDLAGIIHIEFFLLEETSNWPIQITDQNSNQLVFLPEENKVVATVDEESFKDESILKQSSAGDLYEIALKYSILTRSEMLEQLMDQYRNKPGIAIVSYYNGFKKLFGTNEEPLFMIFTPANGSTITDKAYINVEIEGIQRNRPVYYTL